MRMTILKLAAASLALSMCLCKVVEDTTQAGAATLADFKITTEFTGWTESGYATYNDAPTLQNIIDGGYQDYINQGMIEGFRQKMEGGTTALLKTHEAYVMDFGTAAKAQAIFDVKKSIASSPDSFPGYPTTVAFYTLFLGGIRVVAHFQAFYFEVSVAGYDDTPTAIADAALFIDFYKQKAK